MRWNTALAVVFLAVLGCSSADGGSTSPASMWAVTVTSGTINEKNASGDSWDTLGGMPDPYVCLTIGNQPQKCTNAVQDTLQPYWNYSFGTATTAALQAGIWVEYWDDDVTSPDAICGGGSIAPTNTDLTNGYKNVGCSVASFTIAFEPY